MSLEDPNRLRWGDLFPLIIPGSASEQPNPITQQIVNARAPNLPETWTVLLYCNIDKLPSGGTAVDFQYNLVMGVGATPAQFTFTFFFGSAVAGIDTTSSPYRIASGTQPGGAAPILFGWKTLVFPAKDIQINCQAFRFGSAADFVCQVGAWVAPRVSTPHMQATGERTGHDPAGGHHWMPPGFEDGVMRY